MRLIGLESKKTWFHERCANCSHDFFYTSQKGILGLMYDKYFFDLDLATHKVECSNNRVSKILENK